MKATSALCFVLCFAFSVELRAESPEVGTRLRYLAMSEKTDALPSFASVDFVYGPEVQRRGRWWQMEIRVQSETNATPDCIVRCLTADPLAEKRKALQFHRYQLRIPATGETLEYVDVHSGQPLLPTWLDFEKYFFPQPVSASRRREGAPETCEYLGHLLSLQSVKRANWDEWPQVKPLRLDREMLVGTGRSFKDAEGKRLSQSPKPQNYTYIKFTAEDYRTMIAAGMNLFLIEADQEQWVRSEPVFYLRPPGGTPALRYPTDLYRGNYLGGGMFLDEPAVLVWGDARLTSSWKYFSDTATVVEKRTRVLFESDHYFYGNHGLEKQLSDLKVNFGDMRLVQTELPVWEAFGEAAFYEMKGGGSGIVHEGRYTRAHLDIVEAMLTGTNRQHTAHQVLQWHYAMLRGGARPFGKFWGTAIYGQCDPAIAPEAFTLAYDMGARYFWFWTSDHDHHVPWVEQVELAKKLQQHAQTHPRLSIYDPPPKLDAVITIPNGRFPTMENRWRPRSADKQEEAAQTEADRRFMKRVFQSVHQCFDRGENFDITVDDGHPIKGYRRIIKVSDKE